MEEQYKDDDLSLHDAIMMSHHMREAEEAKPSSGSDTGNVTIEKRKTIQPDSYFSDEDASSD